MELWVASRKGLFLARPAGKKWEIDRSYFLGEPVTAMCVSPDRKRSIVALRMGHFGVKLRRTEDGGETWKEIASPAYPPKPDDPDDAAPWATDLAWVLEGFDPATPDRVWVGTIPGGLFRSDDAGDSWQLIESLWNMPERKKWFGGGYDHPGIHSICVHPKNPDDIVVGVSCGGVWRTNDGGASWVVGKGLQADYMPPDHRGDPEIQDPHRVVQCAAEPEVLWIQSHCGIWKSTDRGASWHEIADVQPSNFGFAVAVNPHNADNAWFAPAQADSMRVPPDSKLVVTRTNDGGKSFAIARDGLPQSAAYHLVYRHGLAVSDDGACLAMASTTGSLWLSEDAGSSWAALSQDLPPVYALRFA